MQIAPLNVGRLVRRYKRFLADVELADGSVVTAHCANPGSMLGLAEPGTQVFLERSSSPARKLAWSWRFAAVDFGGGERLVGIDTSLPNRLVAEALQGNLIPEVAGYQSIRPEVRYGSNSRVDFLLESPGKPPCYLEIKNCHMMRRPGHAEFPDCVTERATKHLHELAREVGAGNRAVLLFVVQMRADDFTLAADIDPTYAAAFKNAIAQGVEAYAYTCRISAQEIVIDRKIPIVAWQQAAT